MPSVHTRAIDQLIAVLSGLIPPEHRAGVAFRAEAVLPTWYNKRRRGPQERRIDVGLIERGVLVGGIEVLHAHKTELDKWAHYRAFGLDVIEVGAEWILAQDWELTSTLRYRRAAFDMPNARWGYRPLLYPLFTRRPFDASLTESTVNVVDLEARRAEALRTAQGYFLELDQQHRARRATRHMEAQVAAFTEQRIGYQKRAEQRVAKRDAVMRRRAAAAGVAVAPAPGQQWRNRNPQLSVCFNFVEYMRLTQIAEKAGVSVAGLMRRVVQDLLKVQVDLPTPAAPSPSGVTHRNAAL